MRGERRGPAPSRRGSGPRPALPPPANHTQRGVILPLVLWTVALLALIGTHLTASGRLDLRTAAAARDAARAEAAADGAVHEAILRLTDGASLHWPADGLPRATVIGGVPVRVAIETLAGRVNPNTAPGDLIAALLLHLGMDQTQAIALGAAVFDWRMPGPLASAGGTKAAAYRAAGLGFAPPGQPFERDGEIAAVLGMTPEAAAALRPFLSIHNDGAVDPRAAPPPVRLALEDTGTNQVAAQVPSETVEITAVARLENGTAFARRAVARFRAGEPFQFLVWSQAE